MDVTVLDVKAMAAARTSRTEAVSASEESVDHPHDPVHRSRAAKEVCEHGAEGRLVKRVEVAVPHWVRAFLDDVLPARRDRDSHRPLPWQPRVEVWREPDMDAPSQGKHGWIA